MNIEKLRSVKLFDFVVFDWVATAIFALLIAKYIDMSFLYTMIILLIISIYLHVYFKVPTMTNYYLNLSIKPPR